LKITPLDLRNQEFGRTLRGFDPEEVRVFLELVSDEFELLIKENNSLTERLRGLDEKIRDYRSMEKTLNATLISAQKNADSYFENAKKEADLTLESARMESRRVLEKAQNQKVALEEEIAQLQKTRTVYVNKFKSFLKEQLELLAGEKDEPVLDGGHDRRRSALPGDSFVDCGENPGENIDAGAEMTAPKIDTFRPTFSVDEDERQESEAEDARTSGD